MKLYENWKPASKFCGNFLVGNVNDINKVPNYIKNRCNNDVNYVSWACDHLLAGPRYVTQTQTVTATATGSACATATGSSSTGDDGTTGTPNPPASADPDAFYDDFGPNDVKWEAIQPYAQDVQYNLAGYNAAVHGGYAAQNYFPTASGIFYESILFPISTGVTYRASFTAFYEGSGPCTIQPIVSPSDSTRGDEDPVWLTTITLTGTPQTYDYTWDNEVFSYATFYLSISCTNNGATVWFDETRVKKQQ